MKKEKNLDTPVFASDRVLEPSPADVIPQFSTDPEVAYQMVKEETYPQTNPMLNLATFVTTYMD
ncbi:MAG: glutamate decarboxylase, partial [Bacteroidales bacterium]|nr:glutamate decarboxylase [Bacteroidales bacterium]